MYCCPKTKSKVGPKKKYARAGLLIRRHKSGNDNEKRKHKVSLRVVLRLSLQSEDETNDPLKSGPALAGPAGPPVVSTSRRYPNDVMVM